MNIKHYSTALFCALFLTACGGGGDSKNSQSQNDQGSNTPNDALKTPEFQQWATIFIDPQHANDLLNYSIETTTMAQGKVYNRTELAGSAVSDDTFTVTANGYYGDGPTHSNYGELLGDIRTNQSTWEIRPYSPIQSTDLTLTMQQKQKDVSGKNIAELFAPFEYIELKKSSLPLPWLNAKENAFYNAIYKTTFPAGSRCIQVQSVNHSVAFADLDLTSLKPEKQTALSKDWTTKSQDAKHVKFNFKDTIAYIHPESSMGIAQYKDKFYEASYEPAGKAYDLDEILKDIKSEIDAESDPITKAHYEEVYRLFNNSCEYFNQTAADAIIQHLK